MTSPKPLATFLNERVHVIVGDITAQNLDAIVNAANSTLLGGGGVDGAIHLRGGWQILAECRELRKTRFPNGLPTGEAVLTTAGALAARYVIHTVGPITSLGEKPDANLLEACYRNSLAVANEHILKSVAFPAISTGAFGYPREEAAAVSSAAIKSSLRSATTVELVRLVFFGVEDARIFLEHQKFAAR